ncbi:ubiquitin thioesterase OTU1, partial [Phenoliferia sp. Uapishka_3]
MPLTIRLRGSRGTSSIQLETADCTLQELREKIHLEYPEILVTKQDLRLGFPPKPLPPSTPPETTLSSLGIKNGEPIILAELSEDYPVASSPTAPAQTSSPSTSLPPPAKPPVPPTAAQPKRVEPISTTSLPASSRGGTAASPDFVELDGGYLVLRAVPDDNSCLFRAVGLVTDPGRADSATHLRKVVADAVLSDPSTWSEAVLGRSPESYVKTITGKDSWGGAIELSIFSKHSKVEICSMDVSTGRIDRFGQGEGYSNSVFVVYSGIHYDALTFSYSPPEASSTFPPPNIDFDQTSFPVEQDSVVAAALSLVGKLKARHAYTDTASFTLRCEVCGKGLTGEKEARAHASETSHTSFGEYE